MENGCAGSGCTDVLESYTYNLRLQPVTITLGTLSNPSADYCLVYNFYANSYYPNSCSPTPQNWGGDDGMLWNAYYGDNVNPSLSHTELYSYDGLKRLTTAQATGNSTYNLTFAYDRYGNMTCQTNAQTQGLCPNYSFDQTTNRINTPGFAYDAAGNLTSDGAHSYQYDAEGHSISVDNGSTSSTTFNALGWRVERTNGWTDYLHDPWGQSIGGYWNGGANQFLFWGERLLGDYEPGGAYLAHANSLGSTTQTTDWSGTANQEILYYPWGQVWNETPGYAVHQVFASLPDGDFVPWQDQTTTRRYYPSVGRWLSPDPLGGDITNPQSLNRYAYVLNSPVTLTDPSGLDSCTIGSDCVTVSDTFPDPINAVLYEFYLSQLLPGNTFQYVGPPGFKLNAVLPPKPTSLPLHRLSCSVSNTSISFGQYFRGVASAGSMFGQFLTGTGPRDLTFGPQSVQSQMMSSSPGVTTAVNKYLSSGRTTDLYTFGLSGLIAAGANPIQQFVGSYRYSITPANGGLNVTLSNYTSVWSGSYHIVPSHQRSTFGPMGTTHQTYEVFIPCHP